MKALDDASTTSSGCASHSTSTCLWCKVEKKGVARSFGGGGEA